MEGVSGMSIPKRRDKVFLFINTVPLLKGIFHHRGTRLRKGYGAAGAFTEGFSFFTHREKTMGKKSTALRGKENDKL